jgi:hypothetical protein
MYSITSFCRRRLASTPAPSFLCTSLVIAALLIQGCGATAESRSAACANYDASPTAIRDRLVGFGDSAHDFVVASCVSEAAATDVREEACLIDAKDPNGKPAFASGPWARETIRFIPELVQRLAQREDIALATQFGNEATHVYADANLTRAIVYKKIELCELDS